MRIGEELVLKVKCKHSEQEIMGAHYLLTLNGIKVISRIIVIWGTEVLMITRSCQHGNLKWVTVTKENNTYGNKNTKVLIIYSVIFYV